MEEILVELYPIWIQDEKLVTEIYEQVLYFKLFQTRVSDTL